MAQLGGAQREPSMEEILASIRRIIEDSDPVRRSDTALQPVRPANDTVSSATGPVSTPSIGRAGNDASVIAVDAFRAGQRSDETAAHQREAPATASLRTQPAEKAETQTTAERSSARMDISAMPKAEAGRSGAPQGAAGDRQADTPSVDDWRLGVSGPDFVESSESMDIDMDEVADAVLRDISSSQSVAGEVSAPEPVAPPEPTQKTAAAAGADEPVRPSIVSEQIGRQVAASFSELSEALAARHRKNLDEMAEEMLRPMLRDWLDSNLPALVERLVREEIERIARGAAALN